MKLEIRLNEEQLREIVQEAIENFKKELCEGCPHRVEEDENNGDN